MAPRRKAAEKGQESSVLGKRSREPLAENTTNARPKRGKSAPDSHPGEKHLQDSSKGKSTSKSKTRIIDNTTDDESLDEVLKDVGGDFFDEEVYDEDFEDVDDEDTVETTVKDAEQAAQLQYWFRYSDENDRLAGLSSQERDGRIERCRARFTFILVFLVQTAHQISKGDFDDLEKRGELPFSFPWWIFFLKMSVDKVLEVMLASLSPAAQVILGGSMDSEELLLLPSKWEGCKLWGVYTDIFKKDTVDEAARYSGSGTHKKGVEWRMKMYPAVHNGTRQAEKGAHGAFLQLKNEQPNLRLIAVFSQSVTAKPYVFLMEQLLSILLQTFNLKLVHRRMRASTIEMIRRATPQDLPKPEYQRLNNAAQCLQGLSYRKPKDAVCANCGVGETSSPWQSADPGMPFTRVICSACYEYRIKHNGEERPLALAARPKMVQRRDLVEKAGPKPTGNFPCPGCDRTNVAQKCWEIPRGDFALEPGRGRWECTTCCKKPASELPVNNGGRKSIVRTELYKQAGPKPPPGALCVGCNRPSNQFKIPAGDLALEPGRIRYECQACATKTASDLPVNGGKVRAERRNKAKVK